uniref:HPS1 biogenesis of lysosomal organelles complex 3 subunit 1 n=1 Tax=Gadus morhua TaxID=8049 RepID=A0A8C4ZWT9_GADMO
MKCLLIASESAEVLFYWTDPEFRQNVQDQYGASQEEGQRPPAFEDSLNTLFAPIIISCSTMVDRLGDSYACFTTENQHNYVLHQFDECLYIAVNGDGQECEDDLRRKIYVMKKMIEVLFGMVNLSSNLLRKELRPQDTEQRTGLWKHLQGLLETYSRLRENDQSFLVEAVERLIHPTLCEQCIEFLERRLLPALNSSSERNGEEVLHSFILVHTKLLAFYSSRNTSTLSPSDLLALIVMTQSMYPSNTDQEDPGPEVQPPPEACSHCTTPPIDATYCSIAEDSLITLEVSPPDPLAPTRVFLEVSLKDGLYPMMPHSMYCRPLWPGITLVLLTKIPNSSVAMSVYSYLEAFAKLEKRLSEGQEGPAAARGQPTVHDLRSKLDKFIKALGPCCHCPLLAGVALHHIEAIFYCSYAQWSCVCLASRLIPWCKSMKTQLCGVYKQCFLNGTTRGADAPQRLSPALQELAQAMVQEKLMDWKDFLLVKSKRNITMVSYPDFPGLVHFICVDRSSGQMIAPSLNITERSTSELGGGPLAQFIRGKVWGLVRTARQYLQKGYSTVTLRDGDFYFCYFLWFENETGYKLDEVDLPVLPDDSPPIGVLARDYYRKLLRYYSKTHAGEVVKCYELLTVHLGVIPTEYILQHCRQLASKLWEPSRNPLL